MSYIVLALKWRPKNFDEIVGQDHIVSTLKNAILKDRLAHAYLFSGPRGVGKTSTARILAKALNCKEGPTVTPCGVCPSCVQITKGQSLDVVEIDGASNRGIDEIRALRENVKFSPTQGKFKVYIIDEVHQITSEGFNALLKTLEEPPPFVKFIFATTHPHKVMPTILSRCQRLDFRRVTVLEIISQLEKIIKAEDIKVDKDVLFAVAKASDGSLRDAESILDQLVSFSRDKVSLEDITSMLGLVEQASFFEVTDAIIKKDAKTAVTLFNKIIDEGKDVSTFLSGLIEHFRNLMIAKVAQADSELIDLPQEMCQALLKQSQSLTLEEIFNAFNILVNTQEMARFLESVRIPLEISLVRLSQNKKEEAVRKPEALRQQPPLPAKSYHPARPAQPLPSPAANNKPAPEAPKNEIAAPDNNEPKNPITLDIVKGGWQSLISNLGNVKMSVATFLTEGNPIEVQNNCLVVSFPKNCLLHKESLERKDNKIIIEKSMSELFDRRIKINFILTEEEKKEESAAQHPFIKSALDMFNGRVIKEG
ncbi:MAG: DNA polymerase III subunit gamma/tau [Candidatus Omnitrophica bacterium]|nr:DNA polymerase III subunit gamma/tau [Candidatus Omnitrophota bacterium]